MPYTITDHRHRFGAWAASRAASVVGCRFTVQQGKTIIERAGLEALGHDAASLPEPEQMDREHRAWRNSVVAAAAAEGLSFTHGVAAKLINVYLKAVVVCGGQHDHARVRALHPPIDSVLLKELSVRDVGGLRREWNEARRIRWSKFDSAQYEAVIAAMRRVLGAEPLWTIEQHWQGYQQPSQHTSVATAAHAKDSDSTQSSTSLIPTRPAASTTTALLPSLSPSKNRFVHRARRSSSAERSSAS